MATPAKTSTKILISLVLSTAIFAAFWPVLQADFVNFDDPQYVEASRISEGLTTENVLWALTRPHPSMNWQPVTTLSYLVDVQVFGLKPFGHHLVNLLVHSANAVLLLWLLDRLTRSFWRSAFVAGLFALHPMHVEPVAWISSRKDVLCLLFFLLSTWFYASYVERIKEGSETGGSRRSAACYVLALCCFVAALMSKATAVTLPFVWLLLDYWPLERFKISATSLRKQVSGVWPLVRGKIPFFLLAAFFAGLGSYLLAKEGGTQNFGDIPLSNRVVNGVVAYAKYLGKLFWPADLSVFYPRLSSWPTWQLMVSFLLLFGCTTLAMVYLRRRPYLFVGWFWFVGTLFPVAGIVHQLGGHAMADRYAYIAYPGLFIAFTWLTVEIFNRINLAAPVIAAMGIAVSGILLALTNLQARVWQNSETLFRHALAANKNNAVAHNYLGSALMRQGRLKEAEQHFADALRIPAEFPFAQLKDAQINYGVALARNGKVDEGMNQLFELLRKRPNDEDAHYGLGLILQEKGDLAAAIEQYQEALRLKPEDADALNNLAWIRAANGKAIFRNGEEAVRLAERACEITRSRTAVMIGTLAAAYAEAGRFEEAIAAAERAQSVARELGLREVAEKNQQLLELYKARRAYHEDQ